MGLDESGWTINAVGQPHRSFLKTGGNEEEASVVLWGCKWEMADLARGGMNLFFFRSMKLGIFTGEKASCRCAATQEHDRSLSAGMQRSFCTIKTDILSP